MFFFPELILDGNNLEILGHPTICTLTVYGFSSFFTTFFSFFLTISKLSGGAPLSSTEGHGESSGACIPDRERDLPDGQRVVPEKALGQRQPVFEDVLFDPSAHVVPEAAVDVVVGNAAPGHHILCRETFLEQSIVHLLKYGTDIWRPRRIHGRKRVQIGSNPLFGT